MTGERARAHVQAFNAAVADGAWARFSERFTPDAVMRFPQLPVPEAVGPRAIAALYHRQPPTDTMTATAVRSDGEQDEVDFAWSAGGTGTMVLVWAGERLQALDVRFD